MHARGAAALARAQQRGEALRFLFSRGHRPPRGGGVGPGRLSQCWEAPLTAAGEVPPTAEHSMTAEKARLFGDEEVRRAVLPPPTRSRPRRWAAECGAWTRRRGPNLLGFAPMDVREEVHTSGFTAVNAG